ncbi:MAG: hypothetical protein ACLUNO_06550 [Oscillospiraceae bacterium]
MQPTYWQQLRAVTPHEQADAIASEIHAVLRGDAALSAQLLAQMTVYDRTHVTSALRGFPGKWRFARTAGRRLREYGDAASAAVKKHYFLTRGLRPDLQRTRCPPEADGAHVCRPRSIFFAAHVAEENN